MRLFAMTLIIAIFLVASPAHAVLYQIVSATSTEVVIDNGDGQLAVRLDTLQPGSDTRRAAELEQRLNALATNHQLRSALPLGDGIRLQDPGFVQGEREFWCDVDRNPTPGDDVNGTHLCSRADVIEVQGFTADGVPIITVRSSNDCFQDPSFPSCQ